MTLREQIPLSSLTTFKIGGVARYVVDCLNESDVRAALSFAREQNLSWYVLGEGSNVLAPDDDYYGVIIRLRNDECVFEDEGTRVRAIVGAGKEWDSFVTIVALRGLWGVENLAGIPGTIGAAPVQNIGAYGAELKNILEWVEAFDAGADRIVRFANSECGFGYRDSRFKHERNFIITRVSFLLAPNGAPSLEYPDLIEAQKRGEDLSTPRAIGEAVRGVRSGKFPDLARAGTAGSFFKNPIITQDAWDVLANTHPGLPGFPVEGGVKIPLAWILDKVLNLRGASEGFVGLFGKQPLVIVTQPGASARDVSAFADSIAKRVYDATGITIEREVQTLAHISKK